MRWTAAKANAPGAISLLAHEGIPFTARMLPCGLHPGRPLHLVLFKK